MNNYALLGKHLSHSYSKIIHEYLFKTNNQNAKYFLLDINENDIPNYLEKLRNGEFKGFNVTIPYKEMVIPFLDELTPAAKTIKAVNTIYLRNGKLIGDNTDYVGFNKELMYYGINVKDKDVYILGTGGASKAINYALKILKARTHLVSRSKEKGITYEELAQKKAIYAIVNTTPVGMFPNINFSPITKEVASAAEIVIDLIFNPAETLLLSYNKNHYNGLLMLIYQAIYAEEVWFNKNINCDIEELIVYLKEVISNE